MACIRIVVREWKISQVWFYFEICETLEILSTNWLHIISVHRYYGVCIQTAGIFESSGHTYVRIHSHVYMELLLKKTVWRRYNITSEYTKIIRIHLWRENFTINFHGINTETVKWRQIKVELRFVIVWSTCCLSHH